MIRSKWEQDSVLRLRRYLVENHSPREDMGGMLAGTGVVGFLTSALLLHLGLSSMGWRYLAAAAVAYVCFLLMLVVAVRNYERRLRESHPKLTELVPHPPELRKRESSPDSPDLLRLLMWYPNGCGYLVSICIVVFFAGLPWVVAHLMVTAPTLLADFLLDSLLIGGLHRQNRTAEPDSLAITALHRTLGPGLVVIMILGLVGLAFGAYAPEAVSVWDVFRDASTDASTAGNDSVVE